MEERRSFVRFQAPFCVQYNRQDTGADLPGVVKDISMGGARIMLDEVVSFTPETNGNFSIIFPESTLGISGRIVWAKQAGDRSEVGLTFENVSEPAKEDIYNYIFAYFREEMTRRWWQPPFGTKG